MTDKIQNLEKLIAKCISGNASQDEITQIESWKTESERNRQIYHESLKIWENSNDWIAADQIDLDKAKILIEIGRELKKQIKETKRRSLVYKIAAAVAIPLTFAISFYLFRNSKEILPMDQFCSVSAPKGYISKCILPDGTEAWVNTGSTITYNTSTYNRELREIRLEGEAYFQVCKDKKLFLVNTPLADIWVTGTAFNVKAYPGSGTFETVLDDGSITMQLRSQAGQDVQLKPGERAVFDLGKRKINIESVETVLYSSWRNGEIIFKDATLNDLIGELERVYDIRFRLKDEKLGEFRFRGMFRYNNNLIDALEKISKTAGIKYYIENKEAWLSR